MIIFIGEKEAAALTLHMSVMRKSFRNLIKSKYTNDRAAFLQSYDYIMGESKKALEGQYTAYALNMNIKDLELLHEFLRSYIAKATQESDKADSVDFKEHLYILSGVRDKANECLCA
ncbi:hypothetical protein [Solibacillus sp. FSL K6-1523]|uniref:hypothetical protein n=1 Tax=Solibacillus sp. FSL K6-1523 TaxID=2921471 RepID=UPI0030F62945